MLGLERENGRHRPKRLLATDPHLVAYVQENGGGVEKSLGKSTFLEGPTSGRDLCAPMDRVLDQSIDLVQGFLIDQRPYDHTRLEPRAHLDGLDLFDERLRESVGNTLLDVNPVRTDAGLTRHPEVFDPHRPLDRCVKVGIFKDDEGRIAAQLE